MSGETQFAEHIAEPWYSHIVSGKKRYEGRLRGSDWERVYGVGAVVKIYSEDENGKYMSTLMEIVSFTYAEDFEELYDKLGEELMPGVNSRDEVEKIYSKWFSKERIQSRGGVVGIELKLKN